MRRRVLPLLVTAPILMLSVPAFAHVEVEADKASAGAQNVTLTFNVPNELAPATTVAIRIVLPTDHPLIGVHSKAQHGFAATVKTRHLANAIPGPDGAVSDVATEVDFAGGHLTGTEELPFTISVRQLPKDATTLTFKALQTYDSGTIVSWIEVAADGAAEPEHPAPILKLTPAAGAGPAAPAGQQGGSDAVNAVPPARAMPKLLLASIAVAALAAIGAALVAHRRARRTDLPDEPVVHARR